MQAKAASVSIHAWLWLEGTFCGRRLRLRSSVKM
jgi:hypothetical protein